MSTASDLRAKRWNYSFAAVVLLLTLCNIVSAQTKPTAGIVDQLATSNPPATIRGEPPFEKATWSEFDSREGSRVEKAIDEVVQQTEKLWPELVEHLRDERYCRTVGIDAGYPCNWTVGDLCQNLIGKTLSEAYFQHVGGTKEEYHQFRLPDFAKDKAKLREWCLARKDRKLFELQVEACELVIAGREDSKFTKAVKTEIENLRKSKRAITLSDLFR